MLIFVLGGSCLYGTNDPIAVGVVLDGASQKDRNPIIAYLTKAMGQPVKLVAPDSYGETVAHLADGSYDFACLGALQYIRAHAKYGVIPLVQRVADLHYRSIFITGVHSSIRSLSDLKKKQFAFGDIGSTSAHLMAYRELRDAGLDPETDFKFRYSGSHLATAALVASGAVDAGAIDKTVYDYLVSSGQVNGAKIRVFYISKPYIDYVYVARKDLPAGEREKFARALLALKPEKDDLILRVLRADKFVVANDQEYRATRAIAHDLGMF